MADYEANKPRAGQTVLYRGKPVGKVVRVEGNLCWRTYPDGGIEPFMLIRLTHATTCASTMGINGQSSPAPMES